MAMHKLYIAIIMMFNKNLHLFLDTESVMKPLDYERNNSKAYLLDAVCKN